MSLFAFRFQPGNHKALDKGTILHLIDASPNPTLKDHSRSILLAFMAIVDPITYIVTLGAVVVSFLWLRDTRIYARTGLAGYRKAAYQGVLFTALGWFAAAVAGLANVTLFYLGCGLVLLALYLQSRITRGDVWKGNESALQRFTGAAPRQNQQRKH